jgi:hypothetical protein
MEKVKANTTEDGIIKDKEYIVIESNGYSIWIIDESGEETSYLYNCFY